MAKKLNYLLDACALIAVLRNEKGVDTVTKLLEQALLNKIAVYMCSVNLLEVYYDQLYISRDKAEEVFDTVNNSCINIIDYSAEFIRESARFKTNYAVSLADSALLGIASYLDIPVVSSDHAEFDAIKHEKKLKILFIR
ncbi:MAG: PIN domain-containing protein [Spirochaetaceae bacterium]|jgi:PIN domain nuclease of toxin-antitoxin system|nr:PIN domain-containing protein [Spirochaetaceae bacterium]